MLKYECQHCRDEMTFIYNNRNKYCNKPECQRALVKINIEQKKSIHKAHHKILLDLHETHIEDLEGLESGHHIPLKLLGSIEQNKPITALLPDNTNRVTRLPEERKEGFLSHLRALFNGIKTGEKNSFPIYADELEAPLSSAESSLLGNACATCKGYCCTGGGAHHAFQDYPSLQQYLSAQPEDITEEDLVEAYRHYIPTESYRNSCVFQGHHGCTLPSDMRSFTCHNYRCSSLTTYQQDLAKSTSELTYAAAFDGDTITRTNIFDTQDFVPLLIVH